MASEESQDLLQRALQTLESGDLDEAGDLLRQAIEADSSNVEAWEQLAKILPEGHEKRIALSTILQLDPDNEYAQAETQRAEEEAKPQKRDDEDIVPGITRREARMVALGLGAFTLIFCGVIFAIVIARSSQRAAAAAEAQQAVLNITRTREALDEQETQIALELTEEAQNATATAFAITSPTPTASETPDLPTPIPDTPTPTEVTFRVAEAPPPLPGQIYVWGGTNPQSDRFLNISRVPAAGGSPSRLNSDLVRNPTVGVAGEQMVYELFDSLSGSWTLHSINAANTQIPGRDLNNLWAGQGVTEAQAPKLSADGRFLTFVGRSSRSDSFEVFLLDLQTDELRQITSDNADYSTPAVSPDGSLVIAARDDGTGVDLVLIQARQDGFPQTPLTSDGYDISETSPAFSPDGAQVVYSAASFSTPDDADLYILRLTGTRAAGGPVVTTSDSETFPAFSPDGRYLVYSANAAGVFNVFVHDISSGQTYQVTEESSDYYVAGWANR